MIKVLVFMLIIFKIIGGILRSLNMSQLPVIIGMEKILSPIIKMDAIMG